MEKKALLSASLTLYAGLYFVTSKGLERFISYLEALPVVLSWVLIILVFVLNAIFFLSWIKALVLDYKKQFKEGKEKAKRDKEEKERLIKEGKLKREPPKKSPLACFQKKKKVDEADPEAGNSEVKAINVGNGEDLMNEEEKNINSKNEDRPPMPNNDDVPPPKNEDKPDDKKKKQKAALCYKQRKTT
jgi:hypothetical protein